MLILKDNNLRTKRKCPLPLLDISFISTTPNLNLSLIFNQDIMLIVYLGNFTTYSKGKQLLKTHTTYLLYYLYYCMYELNFHVHNKNELRTTLIYKYSCFLF